MTEKHKGFYSYEKWEHPLSGSTAEKSTIICPIHGKFEQIYYLHVKGNGCQKCGLESMAKKNSVRVQEIWDNPEARAEFLSHRGHHLTTFIKGPSEGVRYIARVLRDWDVEYQGGENIREEFRLPSGHAFDFYLPDYNLFIEFHGSQHYRGWKGKKENLKKKQKNDAFKAQWAEDNGYGLLVIPYWDIKDIEPILAEALGM